jgi:hypothetical protein
MSLAPTLVSSSTSPLEYKRCRSCRPLPHTTLRHFPISLLAGVVHAKVEQKLLNSIILSIFLLTNLVFVTLLLCDATNFRNRLPKRSQL